MKFSKTIVLVYNAVITVHLYYLDVQKAQQKTISGGKVNEEKIIN
jgi:hypothetical protein